MTHTNRLAEETSPYLLQHQHNPVDWYAWGEEAFRAAREQGKAIFLSVGYSTCYWCHVMERESFENPRVAAEMNARFVNIKVDREERPDVDQLYMAAVQIMTRHGGWPMSVFLTPELRPFYGGTYFPVEDMGNRPGFLRVLAGLEEAWKERRPEVERTADSLLSVLHRLATPTRPETDLRLDLPKVEAFVQRTISDFDAINGGFGRAPKFPRETSLRLLLAFVETPGVNPVLRMRVMEILGRTLDAMDMGGIHDHLGGGFHRYSTDERWLVPHFEIMLYDQAMLAEVYAVAARVLGEPKYGDVARGICDFVLREMTGPAGEFHTAMDAEVDGREGLNYLWTESEVREILGAEDAALFSCTYGVDQGPNFVDPHHGNGHAERSILFLDRPIEQAAFDHGIALEEYLPRMAAMRAKLKAVRDQRKQPLLDTKVITGWNGLMAEALAVCGRELGEERYLAAARANIAFLLGAHRSGGGGLLRSSRNGRARQAGFVEDYASVARAALAAGMTAEARHVAGQLELRFAASACGNGACGDRGACGGGCGGGGCGGGGALFFTDGEADDLIVRQKVGTDSPLPAGNAQAALAFLALGNTERAKAILTEFAQSMEDNAEGMSAMVEALLAYVRSAGPLEVAASRSAGALTSPESQSRIVVQVEARLETETELWVRLTIAHGWHVNGPEATEGLTATRLTFEGATVDYPATQALGGVSGYAGEVILRARFAHPPESTLRGAVTYQPCSETACLAAVTREIEIEV
jgi:uncharacterized protein YyaL (SSP411 family)